METIQLIITILSLITGFGSVCVMVYGLSKFLTKPQDTLNQRVTVCETKIDEHERRLNKGDEHFNDNDEAIQILLRSLISLIEFEIQYVTADNKPISEDLKKAKDNLNDYLAKR